MSKTLKSSQLTAVYETYGMTETITIAAKKGREKAFLFYQTLYFSK
jgi:acyl-CoA synthetase (AMP-forming)/AMP-acid ligase II